MKKQLISAVVGLASAVVSHAGVPRTEENAEIEAIDARFAELVDLDAKVTILAEGFRWSEGPVWQKAENRLLFSDVPGNRIHAWSAEGGLSTWMEPSGFTGPREVAGSGSNGLSLDENGALLICEHGDRRVSRLTEHGGKVTLADQWQGKRFNSPNDLAVARDGTIYFTDPPYGLGGKEGERHEDHVDYQAGLNGVYRLEKDSSVELEVSDMKRPNGICLSLDESLLYVANSDHLDRKLMVFPVAEDGTLEEGRVFFDFAAHAKRGNGNPDGIRVDEQGNIWTTGPGGVYCISPGGELLGHIDVGSLVANLTWGEAGHTLFLTAHKRLISLPTKVKGGRIGN